MQNQNQQDVQNPMQMDGQQQNGMMDEHQPQNAGQKWGYMNAQGVLTPGGSSTSSSHTCPMLSLYTVLTLERMS